MPNQRQLKPGRQRARIIHPPLRRLRLRAAPRGRPCGRRGTVGAAEGVARDHLLLAGVACTDGLGRLEAVPSESGGGEHLDLGLSGPADRERVTGRRSVSGAVSSGLRALGRGDCAALATAYEPDGVGD